MLVYLIGNLHENKMTSMENQYNGTFVRDGD